MAVNKNFVVKNGLEVKSNLLVADTSLDSVGIGTSFIKEKLHVMGGIGATTLFVGGIGTVHVATGNTARYENINITGLGTIATLSSNAVNAVSINASGIVTANKFYGDGSTLTGVSVGVRTAGAVLGYGVTFLDIRGSGVSTAYFNTNVGIATLNFEGGGSGGSVSISSAAPSNPNNGDLWYSIDYGRTFVYYDEVELGVGSTAVWVDAAPFNNGGQFIGAYGGTAYGAIGYTAGTASSTSIYFTGDPNTGVYQPTADQLSISAGGVGVATFNPGGFYVGGAATVSSDLSVAGNLNVTGDLVYDEERGANILVSGVATATGLNVLGISSVKDLNVVGVATIATLNATTVTPQNLTLQTGVTTNATNTNLTVTGITTIADSKTQTGVTTNLTATNLTVTGITTLASATINSTSSTSTSLTAATGVTTNATNTLLRVTGVSTFIGAATFNDDVTFTGASANVTWDKSTDDLIWQDNAQAKFGTGGDLSIYHDSSHSYISDQGTGSLKVLASDFQVNNAANAENMITASEDGAAALYYNGTSRIQTTNTGVNVTGTTTDDGATHDGDVTFTGDNYNVTWDKSADDLIFADNAQAHFGTGGDLKLYHDGSNSYIQQSGTGSLIIYGTGETLASFADDGGVSLRYDNTERFQTKGDGINVTGNVDCDSLNNAGITTLTGAVSIAEKITSTYSSNEKIVLSGSTAPYIRWQESSTNKAYIQWSTDGYLQIYNQEDDSVLRIKDDITFSDDGGSNNHSVVHQGNVGSGGVLQSKQLNVNALYAVDTSSPLHLYGWMYFESTSDQGIYWNAGTGQGIHVMPASTSSLALRSDQSATGLQIRTASATLRGSLYADNSNNIGFLDNGGDWAVQSNRGSNSFTLYDQHFKTDTDSTYDLGTNSVRWRNLYADTLYGDGSNLTGVGDSIAPWRYNPDVNDTRVDINIGRTVAGQGTFAGIGITFNKKVVAGSGTATLKIVNAGAAGTTIQSWGVSSCTFDIQQFTLGSLVSPLTINQTYQLDIPSGFLLSSTGTAYAGTAYTFTARPISNAMYTWGDDEQGQGARNTSNIDVSSPVQITGTRWVDAKSTVNQTRSWIIGTNDGTLWGVGYNHYGMLGQNDQAARSSPTQIPGTTWSGVVGAAQAVLMATKTDGTLWTIGRGNEGGTGVNNEVAYSSPVQVPGTNWVTDNVNGLTMGRQALALKTNGQLWGWGDNTNGCLGQNNRTTYSSPVQIPGTTWAGVWACGHNGNNNSVYAVKTDGTGWVWGCNERGQLGMNNKTKYSSPVQLPGTWASFGSNSYSMTGYGIKTNGEMWVMGKGHYGQLGLSQSGNTAYSSPVQIPGTTWSQVDGGFFGITGAVRTDGTLWTWGHGDNQGGGGHNQGGPGETNYSSPKQVGTDTDWIRFRHSDAASYGFKEL